MKIYKWNIKLFMKWGNLIQADIQLPHVLTAKHKRNGERKSTTVYKARMNERK